MEKTLRGHETIQREGEIIIIIYAGDTNIISQNENVGELIKSKGYQTIALSRRREKRKYVGERYT